MNLKNKIAVVTGASKGLGKSISEALIRHDVRVYGLARSKATLEELESNLGDLFTAVPMDITNQDSIDKWVKETFSDRLSPDILINNAGVGSFHAIDETSPETWHKMINANLNGMYYITSGLIPFMKNKGYSTHIINIGSILGTVGRAQSTAYSTTKFGIQGFSKSLLLELRYDHVKVTCLNPGSIETDFFSSSGVQSHDHMLHVEDIAKTVIHLLESPDNYLISDLTIRPLIPKPAK